MPKEIDASKEFSNGHKTFTSMEAMAMQQLQTQERNRAEYFQANKHTMHRPRNPVLGEATPREGSGEPLMPAYSSSPSEGEDLMKNYTAKVGEITERYNILGNSLRKKNTMELTRMREDPTVYDIDETERDLMAESAILNQTIPSGIKLK